MKNTRIISEALPRCFKRCFRQINGIDARKEDSNLESKSIFDKNTKNPFPQETHVSHRSGFDSDYRA